MGNNDEDDGKKLMDFSAISLLYFFLKMKAVMLQGQPSLKTFSSGWDSSCDNPLAAFARYQQLAYLLATVKKPTISWFNGKVSSLTNACYISIYLMWFYSCYLPVIGTWGRAWLRIDQISHLQSEQ